MDTRHTDLLRKYHAFHECVLMDYRSDDLCRDFVVTIINIWSDKDELLSDAEAERIELRFVQCQDILIHNAFWQDLIDHPEEVNWGINEFARIRVTELDGAWHRFEIRWEGTGDEQRMITITCRDLVLTNLGLHRPPP